MVMHRWHVGGHGGRVDVVGPRGPRWRPGSRKPCARRARPPGTQAMPARRSRIWRTHPVRHRPPIGTLLGLLRRGVRVGRSPGRGRGGGPRPREYRDNLEILNRRPARGRATMSGRPRRASLRPTLDSPNALPPVDIPDMPLPLPPPPRSLRPLRRSLSRPPSPHRRRTPAVPGLAAAPEPEPTSPAPPVPSPAALPTDARGGRCRLRRGEGSTMRAGCTRRSTARSGSPRAPRPLGLLPLGGGRPPDQRRTDTAQQEWASINAEIQKIRALSPKNWFGEYLRNLAAERTHVRAVGDWSRRRSSGAARRPRSRRLAAVNRLRPLNLPLPDARAPRTEAAPAAVPNAAHGGDLAARPSGHPATWATGWSARRPNFRIFHADTELAEKIALEAPRPPARPRSRAGSGPPARGPWSPKCDIYLYPTGAGLQPDDRPARGFARVLDDGDERGPDHRPADQPPRRPPQPVNGDPAPRDHARRPGRPLPRPADPPLGRRGDGRPLRAALRAASPRGRPGRAARHRAALQGRGPDGRWTTPTAATGASITPRASR